MLLLVEVKVQIWKLTLCTVFGKKGATTFCLQLCQILTDFQNSFTDRLSSKAMTKYGKIGGTLFLDTV